MGDGWVASLISTMLPIFIILAIWIFLARRMSKGMGGGILGVGKAGKLINSEKPETTFDNVAGAEEAKEEVKEIVDFLKISGKIYRAWCQDTKRCTLSRSSGYRKNSFSKSSSRRG